MKFCAGLLEKDNLAKHAKIIEFIEAPIIEKFTNHLKHLATTNAVYASLNIAMTVAYAIKLVYDVFILSSC
jgi:glutamine amidotransferase PdxT